MIDFDLVVVGAGPVGLACAAAALREGFRVAVIERAAAPVPAAEERRYYALSPATCAWLQALGVGAPALLGGCAYMQMQVWEDQPHRGLRFTAADIGEAQLGWIVGHDVLVQALLRLIPASVLQFEAALQALHEEADAKRLTFDRRRPLRARLVVAADGGESPLRRMIGLPVVGWDYAQRGIVANVRCERWHQHTAWQRFLPTGPLAFLPLADGRCSIVWSVDEPQASVLLGLGDADFARRLEDAFQRRLGAVGEVGPRIAFPLRLRHAPLYAADRVALVGDAAHVIHPLAGQGLNLGLADARALVETLSAARSAGRDWSAPRNLQRYARARKADNLEMLALTDALQRLYRVDGALIRTLRRQGLSTVSRLAALRAFLARQAAD